MAVMVGSAARGRLPWVVGLVGVVLVAGLAVLLVWWDRQNEERLLREQTEQAGVVLTVGVNQFLEPLHSIARAADVTDGDRATFDGLAAQLMSGADAQPYSAIVLLDRSGTVLAHRGAPLALDTVGDVDTIAPRTDGAIAIHDLLHTDRTLGFAATSPSADHTVYAERQLSPEPTVRRRTDGPFASLDYAIYLGPTQARDHLLGASTADLPLAAPSTTVVVPYGDQDLLLATSPVHRLGDSLLARLWWIVLAVGLAVTAAIALLLHRVQASRQRALDLARLSEEQHHEQRDIAETLQLELLPQDIAPPPGLHMTTRYWVADTESLIGGDTYDVFRVDDHRWAILVGDVCGKGTEAAALTGLLRHTARTAARFVESPAAVLHAVHVAMAEHRPRTYCTVALMIYRPDDPTGERPGGELTIALGGHPAPLLREPDGSVRAVGRPGTLLGMIEPSLHDTTVRFEPGATLLAYTDGLTDAARGRALTPDDLRASLAPSGDVDAIANGIRQRRSERLAGGSDDTVVLVVAVDGARAAAPEPPESAAVAG